MQDVNESDVRGLLVKLLTTAKEMKNSYRDEKEDSTPLQRARWENVLKSANSLKAALEELKWYDDLYFMYSSETVTLSQLNHLKQELADVKQACGYALSNPMRFSKPSVSAHREFVVTIAEYLFEHFHVVPIDSYNGEKKECNSAFAALILAALPMGTERKNGRWIHEAMKQAKEDGYFKA